MGSVLGVPVFFCNRPHELCGDFPTAAPSSSKNFDAERYFGRWETVLRRPSWFEDGVGLMGACNDALLYDSVALYTQNTSVDGGLKRLVVDIQNTSQKADGTPVSSIRGRAIQNDQDLLDFEVVFDSACVSPHGVYRIIGFGCWSENEYDHARPYDYLVVAGSTYQHVWLMVRDAKSSLADDKQAEQLRSLVFALGVDHDQLQPTPLCRAAGGLMEELEGL